MQNRMDHSRWKYLRSQQTYRLVLDFCVCIGTQAVFTAKHAFYWCFLLGSFLRSREIFTQVKRLTALVACVQLVQKDSWSLSILISVNRILGRIKSSRFIPAKVDFHGNPTSILYFFGEEIYLELSPFAVKPMFWFSILTNQITGN